MTLRITYFTNGPYKRVVVKNPNKSEEMDLIRNKILNEGEGKA